MRFDPKPKLLRRRGVHDVNFWIMQREPLVTMGTHVTDKTTAPEVARIVGKHEALVAVLREAKPFLSGEVLRRVEELLEDEK